MMYLTLPVPKPTNTIQVTVVSLGFPESAPTRRAFQIPEGSKLSDLAALVSEHYPPTAASGYNESRCFAFAEISDKQINRFFSRPELVHLSDLGGSVDLWAFEVALDPAFTEHPHDYVAVRLRRPLRGQQLDGTRSISEVIEFEQFAAPQVLAIRSGATLAAEVHDRISFFLGRVARKSFSDESLLCCH